MSKEDSDRFADPTVCSAASGEQLPINRPRSTAARLEAITIELAGIAVALDMAAKSQRDDAWKAFYAAEDVKCAIARLRSAVRH